MTRLEFEYSKGRPVTDVDTRHRDGADLPTDHHATRLADLIVERLETRHLDPPRWVGADRVADHLGVEVSYVYEHANELDARRLGSGPRARLRVRLDLVDAALLRKDRAAEPPRPRGITARRRRRSRGPSTHVPLLPIRPPSDAR
jgi:hypothetical protein